MCIEEKHGAGVEQARQMLDVFTSLGVGLWNITWTDLEGHKRCYRARENAVALWRQMAAWLRLARERQHNLIVRPWGAPVELIQLDDLGGAPLERVRQFAFLVLSTSAANQQAWVAVGDRMPELGRRLRQGSGADPSASGATRVAGSVNFKPQYAPDFPMVKILEEARQRVVSSGELEAAGLLAPPYSRPEPLAVQLVRDGSQGRARAWPSYERCLEQAPLTQDGRRADISRVDFTFCVLATDWGWSVAETAERLREKSSKARENGEGYSWRTAQRAAAVVARRHAPLPENRI